MSTLSEPARKAESRCDCATRLLTVYVDTSVPSYLTAWPSRTLPMARDQRITCLWWNVHRKRFEVYVSERVFGEAMAGDPEAAQRRVDALSNLASLAVTEEATNL